MNETPISVTAAARNFADFINRVRYQGVSFLLEKNGVPVARIVPVVPRSSSQPERVSKAMDQAPTVPSSGSSADAATKEQHQENDRSQPDLRPADLPKRPTLNW